MIATLFHDSRKVSHQARSDRTAPRRGMGWCGFLVAAWSSNSRRRNDLPGFTTTQACCNFPARDSSSFFMHERFPIQVETSALSSTSLACGRRSCSVMVSISMPRKVRHVVGPSSFWVATGTPSQLKEDKRVLRSRAHCRLPGEPANRKSSK